MGSENQMNNTTSFHQSDNPIFCANGCGFFGTVATMNLCSKCYRNRRLKEDQAASAKAAVEKSMTFNSPAPISLVVAENKPPVVSPAEELAARPPEKPSNRCGFCNKKVGFMGFKCRCGTTFCGSHRYPEEHECKFDFKGLGRDAIARDNPVVKADKVERF